MKTKILLLIMSMLIIAFSVPFTACSGDNPASPSGINPDAGTVAPGITMPRDSADGTDNPEPSADTDVTIELNPQGEPVLGRFTLGATPVAGIEVRIDDELADITDSDGNFEIPSITEGDHNISFAILGQDFHTQPFSPVDRFAQNDIEPGPGVMTGTVYNETGPVPGALIIVAKGDSYAYTFSGQFGQYNLTGAPAGNALAIVLAEFHDPVFNAVNLPADGTPLEKDFQIEQNLDYGRIYGRAVSPGIGAVPGAYVSYAAPGTFREDLTNIFGIFELEAIPVGDGQIHASREYFYDVDFEYHVDPGLNAIPVVMYVIEQSTVHGYVVDSAGEPLDGALVRLMVTQEDGKYPAVYGALSGPMGYFHFEDLLPGAYVLQAFMPGMLPATELGVILPGSLIEETLMLSEGTGGHAHGWAVDWMGEPIIGAIVQLKYIGSDVETLAVTGDNGYWELNDIPYGACEVVVQSAAWLPGVSWIDIYPNDPGECITMCFPPSLWDAPTGELSGTVYSSTGDPLPYSLVWIFNLASPEASFMTLANESGEYYFPNAIVGTNAGWAIAEGYVADDGYVEIITDTPAVLDFELYPE